ncbi:MAG: DUF2339 domain-containing protein [Clostridiales bacterium]|nr:DUF2339 domain-containing protein [Clostridiales bacterium]
MPDSRNLRDIVKKQKNLLAELEQEADTILHSDLSKENESLKKEVRKLSDLLAESRENLKLASAKNAELSNALYEQVYSEKIRILQKAQKKNDVYFKAEAGGEFNRLVQLEDNLRIKTKELQNRLEKHRTDAANELYAELDILSMRATKAVTEARAALARESGAFTEYSSGQFEKLKAEQATDEMVAAIGEKNNIEAFLGGNLINKLGIVFVILGIVAVAQFTFLRLPDTFKGVIMFAVSGLLLLAGELFNRRKANIFSLGVTSGGVAGLYASLSISYFLLNIISMYPAILLCVLITAGALVLSLRYDSQTVAAFALVGGYIPIISVSDGVALAYGMMVYFVFLNLLALIISFYKKWRITMFIGFALNLAGTMYIIFNMYTMYWMRHSPGRLLDMTQLSTVLYVVFAFAVYTFIPITGNLRTKQPFAKPDTVILGLNTVFSAAIMYGVLKLFGLDDFTGIMAIVFAVAYLALGRHVEGFFLGEKHTAALFYLTGLTFVVLVVPLQFGKEWLSLGWLAQAVSLAAYGILRGEKNFIKAGSVIGGLCFASFVYLDVLLRVDDLFSYKYLAITIGSAIVLLALAYRKSLANVFENAFKYAVLVNAWLYCMYLVSLCEDFIRVQLESTAYSPRFMLLAMAIAGTFAISATLPRIPVIADKVVKTISVGLSLLGAAALLVGAQAFEVFYVGYSGFPPAPIVATASLVLAALCGMSLFAVRGAMMHFTLEYGISVEWMPFSVSAYFLALLTEALVFQFRLPATSIAISIVFVALALAWIIYGFVKRFAFMRRFGLVLSFLAVAKLFIIDLAAFTQGSKIVSYFAFGITLLGISFVYQYFSKRLAPRGGGGTADVENGSS